MEEPPLLMTVQRNIGRVQVDHDPARRLLMGFDEQVHQQGVGLGLVEVDLVVFFAVSLGRTFQTVQRALARQGLAVGAKRRLQLAGQHRHGRVLAKVVVVDEVFVAQRQAEDALTQQGLQPMFDEPWIAPVGEARGEPIHQP